VGRARGPYVGLRAYTGRGVGVAIIDTGIDATHPRLRGRVALSLDFTRGLRLGGRDENGHGTHVASLVREVAPQAHLVSLKAMGADGSGQTSNVLEALDWIMENRKLWNIKVVNISLGHPVLESEKDDPLCQAVKRATEAGILVTVAAGNWGKTPEGTPIVSGVTSPGNSPWALTVGALNTKGTAARSDDVMATYSSRGPTMIDGVLKPELVAPGNRLVGAVPRNASLPAAFPERIVSRGADLQMEMSGTSMSAAVVAGAAALLLEARSLRRAEAKLVLPCTCSGVPGSGLI
jgi:serine protease AprX